MAFRSVPRPSSPPGAKASTECPSHTQSQTPVIRRQTSQQPPVNLRRKTSVTRRQPPIERGLTRASSSSTQLLNTHAPDHSRHTRRDDPWIPSQASTIPSGQTVTQQCEEQSPDQTSQPAYADKTSNRVVLRAQERTRTRFTTQKNNQPSRIGPKPNTSSGPTRQRQPAPRSRGQDKHHRSRIHPIG